VLKRQLLLILAVVWIAALFGVRSAIAGPSNDPLRFEFDYGLAGHHTAQPVDYLTWCGDCGGVDYHTGTPWVVNPRTTWPYNLTPGPLPGEPGCMWDTDDRYKYVNTGNVLAAGASASTTECLYAGDLGYPSRNHDIYVLSPSPNLLVTMKTEWSRTVIATIVPVYDAGLHAWRYLGCYRAPQAIGDQAVTIPDSNGGQAVPQLVTVTVANPTSQKIGKTGAVIAMGLAFGTYCSGYVQL
jgi:hypothetical protein